MIENYENCWIFGDFNYRLSGFTRKEILETIKAKGISRALLIRLDYAKLTDRGDELLRNLTRFYPHFVEQKITFPPTYKFNTKAKTEEMEYSMKRLPSYCDRILFKNNPAKLQATIHEYKSSLSRVSDHLPVCADYTLSCIGVNVSDCEDEVAEGKPYGGGAQIRMKTVLDKRNLRIVKGLVVPVSTVGVMVLILIYLMS
jgi:hypothetical protein